MSIERRRAARYSELGDQVARLIVEADNLKRVWDQGYQLCLADRRLLWLLIDGQPRTLREISECLGLEQSTVNRQVNSALASGLLRRYREHGKSASVIVATDEGRDSYKMDSIRGRDAYSKAMSDLGEADSAHFVALLERFVAAYGRATQGSPRRGAAATSS